MNEITTNTSQVESQVFKAIERADLADSTRIKYNRAIRKYIETGNSLADREALADYAQGLSHSVRSQLKAALKLWADEITNEAKSQADPENIAAVQATVYRLEALTDTIKVQKQEGKKAHTWLSSSEVESLVGLFDPNTLLGLRDRVAIGLMVGAGLRRNEAVELKWSDLIRQPHKDTVQFPTGRLVLNIRGKGKKQRGIPVSESLAKLLDRWGEITGKEGFVLRSVGTNQEIGESLSAVSLFKLVRKAGQAIDKPDLAPHDLRRSFAQIGFREAGLPITVISKLLGHSNIEVTQRYLGEIDTNGRTASDFVPV